MESFVPQILRWLQQNQHHTVLVLDNEGVVSAALGSVERTFGYGPAELVGKGASMLFIPEDLALGLDRHELSTARRVGHMDDDRWMLRKDGARIWIAGLLTALRDDAGEPAGFVKIMRDQTRVRAEAEALRNRLAANRQAEERSVVLFGTLAHELRGPLAPLATACELLRRLCTAEQAQFPLQIIDRQLSVLRRVVEDVMDVARVQTGKLELQPQPLELQGALRQVVESWRQQAQARRIDLLLSVPDVPILIEADPTRFEQIFVNLITNALTFTPAGGQVSIKATVAGAEAVILVEDTGVGIGPEMLPRIFDLFTQEPEAKPLSLGGLGIGLSLVKQLVEAHGGMVQVRSDGRNLGSEFAVRLPLRQASAPAA
jgi:two-component system CheB/CheR fusion protein